MNEGSLDRLIMLLSADWFLDYWVGIGLDVTQDKRICLQQCCRKAVKQQIMVKVGEYWHTDFSAERLKKTALMLQTCLDNCHIDKLAVDRVNALIAQKKATPVDENVRWTFIHLTQLLSQDAPEIKNLKLDPASKEAILNAWERCNQYLSEIDFQELCLSSQTEWDRYLRSATPDLPTYLSDYVSTITATRDKFEFLWEFIKRHLSSTQQKEVLSWYRQAAQSWSGSDMEFPQSTES